MVGLYNGEPRGFQVPFSNLVGMSYSDLAAELILTCEIQARRLVVLVETLASSGLRIMNHETYYLPISAGNASSAQQLPGD